MADTQVACSSYEKAGKGDVDNDNIILNPNFDNGVDNWSGRGCNIVVHDSMGGGKVLPQNGKYFASATNRTQNWHGIQQDVTGRVQRKFLYEATAVVRLFGSNVTPSDVRATLYVQTSNGKDQYIGISNLQASDKDWVQLHGKFLINGIVSKAVIYIEGPPPSTDLLVNSLVVKRAEKPSPAPAPDYSNITYGENIVQNSDLADGLNNWYSLGNCNITVANGSPRIVPPMVKESLGSQEPLSGKYILVTNRTQTWMGPAQTITDKINLHVTYQVSGWVRIGSAKNGPQIINAAIGVDTQWVNGGQVQVTDERWYEIGGSFRVEQLPSKVMVYVQGPAAGVDLMVAGLQIFPVDRKARFKHLKNLADKVRKRDVALKISGSKGDSLLGASIRVKQTQNSFPIGTCINRNSIDNEDYVLFFTKNFNWAVFENELKWYWTEPQQGNLNYTDADELLDLCKKNNIQVRGHCIFWEVPGAVQSWVQALSNTDLKTAVQNRLNSLLTRYKGNFQHYDVNNEMLHGSFYQDRLGKDIRPNFFKNTNQLDPSPTLFVNDYHIEDGADANATPEVYIQHVLGLQEQGAPVGGIGIQGHIDSPVGPVVSSSLDRLGVLGLPIWFTEIDVSSDNEYVRADDLEVMMREAFAHPSVEGIMLWGFWELFMSRDNGHLVNAEGDLNEAGKRFLEMKEDWLSHARGHLGDDGEFKFRGFHGSYTVEVVTVTKKRITQTFTVEKGVSPLVVNINLANGGGSYEATEE
ncbi:Glycosyl hydrolase family 10 protein / carbohydrate-binding domain-containing protein isoform 1 [Rhynchospora pubera]|uniref:Glycosyl hydrolase family 10 protein / carbohydrate-binding domain-containing protein isoform 1 n=1 Tax=Rhynchospora pubera TaxID=906938 RepID=A0AAV8DWK5_9POAL|nr:Glycosyl hydrolase family 10 protein / carbohydrate-binding domain-containing protein isoform 1 [Rhynchospora pubera]